MKLRIKGNSIRFRLTKSEIETVVKENEIVESVNFGNKVEQKLSYVLEKTSIQNLRASFNAGKITVSIPQDVADQWINSEQIGIQGEDGELTILIEKDFACLTPRKGEDESDNFPHPNLEESC